MVDDLIPLVGSMWVIAVTSKLVKRIYPSHILIVIYDGLRFVNIPKALNVFISMNLNRCGTGTYVVN